MVAPCLGHSRKSSFPYTGLCLRYQKSAPSQSFCKADRALCKSVHVEKRLSRVALPTGTCKGGIGSHLRSCGCARAYGESTADYAKSAELADASLTTDAARWASPLVRRSHQQPLPKQPASHVLPLGVLQHDVHADVVTSCALHIDLPSRPMAQQLSSLVRSNDRPISKMCKAA